MIFNVKYNHVYIFQAITEANNDLASAHKSVISLEGMVKEYAPSSQVCHAILDYNVKPTIRIVL